MIGINRKARTVKSGIGWFLNPISVIKKASRELGPSFYLKLPILGKTFVTGDPRILNDIMNHPNLVGGKGMKLLRPVLGDNNLIMLYGKSHKDRKHSLSQLFTRSRLLLFDSTMLRKQAEIAFKYSQKDKVDLYTFFQEVLLTSIVAFLFPQADPDQKVQIEDSVERFLHSVDKPMMLFFTPLQINLGRFNTWGRMLIAKQDLHNLISELMRQQDYYESLQQTMPEEQIIEEIVALLLFGHDTSAASLAWAVHHCLDNRVDLPRLKTDSEYLEAVIAESLRLSPVVVHLTRVATKEMTLGGFKITNGTRVLPTAYIAHFDESVFPEAEKFIPERFIINTYNDSYFPFGFGNRICIGKHFALQQMRVLLPDLFNIAELTVPDDSVTSSVRDNVLMVPKRDIIMKTKQLA